MREFINLSGKFFCCNLQHLKANIEITSKKYRPKVIFLAMLVAATIETVRQVFKNWEGKKLLQEMLRSFEIR
jgi:hypothetical protein